MSTPAPAEARTPQPHDLLWLRPDACPTTDAPLPVWATLDLMLRVPWVARREAAGPGMVAVGLRGTTRSERLKGMVESDAIMRCVSPEDIVATIGLATTGLAPSHGREACPALVALAALRPRLDATGLVWGPTGSTGFQLASGHAVLRSDSDLDLLVRAPRPLNLRQWQQLLAIQAWPHCRIDLQIETGQGAFALAEWRAGHRRVLLKTGQGAVLTDAPWCHVRMAA